MAFPEYVYLDARAGFLEIARMKKGSKQRSKGHGTHRYPGAGANVTAKTSFGVSPQNLDPWLSFVFRALVAALTVCHKKLQQVHELQRD